jgi:RNA ligase (TIGR02306 family)
MRNLASIQIIDDIQPIENADAIEVCSILGWKVVVKKGEFQVGEKVVFCEIDSWVPTEIAPFLSKGKEPREFEGIKGERLRSCKLRSQLSQGLILPVSVLEKDGNFITKNEETSELILNIINDDSIQNNEFN